LEAELDVKVRKAVKLHLLDDPRSVALREVPRDARGAATREAAAPANRSNAALYYDSAADDFEDVLETLKAAGHQPRLVDYAATPLTHDQLKRLAMMLREVDQSLVRRYDHLFLELQLDDRFISESDFWTAIIEHPGLINGPVVVAGNRARICKSADALRAFLGVEGEGAERKPKAISPRMMAMMTGQPVPARPEPEAPRKMEVAALKSAPLKAEARAELKPVAPKPEPKPVAAKAEVKPAPSKAEPKPKAKKAVA